MSSTTAMRRYQPYVCLKQSFRMQNWKRSGDQMISNVITPRSFLIVRRGALHIVARPQRVVYGHNRAQFTPTDVYIIRYSTNIHVCVCISIRSCLCLQMCFGDVFLFQTYPHLCLHVFTPFLLICIALPHV